MKVVVRYAGEGETQHTDVEEVILDSFLVTVKVKGIGSFNYQTSDIVDVKVTEES